MQLVFFTEERFFRGQDEQIYSRGGFTRELWNRYLSVFESVVIVARIGGEGQEQSSYAIPQDKVTLHELPYYVGPVQYLRVASKIRAQLDMVTTPGRAYICRVPGRIGELAAKFLRKKGIPYGVEVVGDPWDVFAPGAANVPFRAFFRVRGFFSLRYCVWGANAALYVTKAALQERYPIQKGAFSTYASDVVLPESRVVHTPRRIVEKSLYRILAIGSLEQMYKAPDVLLEAIKRLKKLGVSCKLTWLGDGRHRAEMEMLASELGISDAVVWRGNVPQAEVDKAFENADIFAMVSRTEGLPRALIEAMAKGLPCIGTRVGGIPELLMPEVLIPPGDEYALADKIEQMIRNPDFASGQATRNWNEAKKYKETVLSARRNDFYRTLCRLSC